MQVQFKYMDDLASVRCKWAEVELQHKLFKQYTLTPCSTPPHFALLLQVQFKYVDDLASVWCEWAEMELQHKQFKRALDLMRRATTAPVTFDRRKVCPCLPGDLNSLTGSLMSRRQLAIAELQHKQLKHALDLMRCVATASITSDRRKVCEVPLESCWTRWLELHTMGCRTAQQ